MTDDQGTVLWSGRLGAASAELRQMGERRVLSIGDWRTEVHTVTRVRHRGRLRGQQLIIEQSDGSVFVHRYRLPWGLQLAPLWDTTYDRWTAEADDPGLCLTELLGGADDWD
ncbi:hypothetical protein QEZ54_17175 [Catellatospora sp. KI3]|uniref:hypothetical protein n=1 Tax=Catellatospora sp. KI3 TaxID=3041620 RepID=UPI002482C33F|nr:hypothetical protein [Catellatospora sp. KI3]MDI1462709.1 hypothetical protein [Catellatospora sp. KI3]